MPVIYTVYGLKNCDSCRHAIKVLRAAGAEAQLVDVRTTPPSSRQLMQWCGHFGKEALLNRRSTTWRGLSPRQRAVDSDRAAVQLLGEFPALMKRPLIVQGDRLLLGFDAAAVQAFVQ